MTFIKGGALNRLGNYTQAIHFYDRALDFDPNEKHSLMGKGDALYRLGNNTKAIQYFDKALDIDPNYKDALSGKVDTLYSQGNYTCNLLLIMRTKNQTFVIAGLLGGSHKRTECTKG